MGGVRSTIEWWRGVVVYPQMTQMGADEDQGFVGFGFYLRSSASSVDKRFGCSELWSGGFGCRRTPLFEDGGEFFGERGEEVVG